MSTEVFTAHNVEHMSRHYVDRTRIVVGVFYPLAVTAVALRFIGRKISKNKIWWDDVLALVGMCATGAFISCLLIDLPTNKMLSGAPIPASIGISNSKTAYVAEIFYYTNQLSLKCSILFFYWRIFSASRPMRIAIYCVGTYVAIWFIAGFLVTVLQCLPVAAQWDPALKATAKCVNLNEFFFGTAIPNILADIFLIILPMPRIWKLNITNAQRICVMFFFMLGGFVVVASIVRLRCLLLVDFKTFPINWAMDNSVLWTAVENSTGVVCVCLPSLRPIVNLVLPLGVVRKAFKTGGSSNTRRTWQEEPGNQAKGIFRGYGPSTQRSQWSEINSQEGPEKGLVQPGRIQKETQIDVVSIEMQDPKVVHSPV